MVDKGKGEEKPKAKATKISADPFAGTDGDFEKSADYDMWSDDEPKGGNPLEKNKDKIQKMYNKGYAPEDIADELGIFFLPLTLTGV